MSKASLPSSTDTEVTAAMQGINFEEKLEQANSLIEKVRETLRDLSIGIQKTSDQKSYKTDLDKPCVEGVCSFHGRCKMEPTKEGKAVKTNEEEKNAHFEEKHIEATLPEKEIIESTTPKLEQRSKEMVYIKFAEAETALESAASSKPEENLDVLQAKLNTINESSESGFSPVKIVDSAKEKLSVERGSSPIDFRTATVLELQRLEATELIQNQSETCSNKKPHKCCSKRSKSRSDSQRSGQVSPKRQESRLQNTISQLLGESGISEIHDISVGDLEKISSDVLNKAQELAPHESLTIVKKSSTSTPTILKTPPLSNTPSCKLPTTPPNSEVWKCRLSGTPSASTTKTKLYSPRSASKLEGGRSAKSSSTSCCRSKTLFKSGSSTSEKRLPSETKFVTLGPQLQPSVCTSRTSEVDALTPKAVSSGKSSRLMVQLMPPVTIRAGLVKQTTLHLCIKPTGSIINTVESRHRNIGYDEVNVIESSSKRGLLKELPTRESDERSLSVECDNRCTKTSGSLFSWQEKDRSKKSLKMATDPDACAIYKSYQVVDEETFQKLQKTEGSLQSGIIVRETPSEASSTDHTSMRKDPYEIGFYQSKAIQCEEIEEVVEPIQNVVPIGARSPTRSEQSRKAKEEEELDALPSQDLPLEPEKDVPQNSLPLTEILHVLNSGSVTVAETSATPSVETASVAKSGSEKPSLEVEGSRSSVSGSSSFSSVNIHGSIGSRSQVPVPDKVKTPEIVEVAKEVKVVKDAEPSDTYSSMYTPSMRQSINVPKVTKAGGLQTDETVQVSLESSSSSGSASAEEDQDETVEYFIKGLVGTSQEGLQRLRSNPSFPKIELLSKTLLRTVQRQSKVGSEIYKRMPKRHTSDEEREEVVETLDYDKNERFSEDESILSEETRQERLRKFQENAKIGDGKKDEKFLMTVREERGDSGEGTDVCGGFGHRHFSFYRRAGREAQKTHLKQEISLTRSAGNPANDSTSEGEVKCRNSFSIGEVPDYKTLHDKVFKTSHKHLKRRLEDVAQKDTGEDSSKIARQRMQYNNWVAYYLQRLNNMKASDDSSSASTRRSSKK